jgi:DNA-binding transcriptional ArsR family regulator
MPPPGMDPDVTLQQPLISESPYDPANVEAAIANAPFRIPEAPAEADLLAKYFRVLGDRTRLRILELISERERSVGDLASELGEPQPKVSNHLKCLRWCGFVVTRREHRTIYYTLADERVAAVIELGRALLHQNADHVAACGRVDGRSS